MVVFWFPSWFVVEQKETMIIRLCPRASASGVSHEIWWSSRWNRSDREDKGCSLPHRSVWPELHHLDCTSVAELQLRRPSRQSVGRRCEHNASTMPINPTYLARTTRTCRLTHVRPESTRLTLDSCQLDRSEATHPTSLPRMAASSESKNAGSVSPRLGG